MPDCLIRFASPPEIPVVQKVFNHPSIIGCLGGFTMEQNIKNDIDKLPGSLWIAEKNNQLVGVTVIGGRPQSHLVKYGSVGVIEGHRRQRIGSALYLAMTLQGILEGRRLFEDSIVGNNPTQFKVLPTLGIEQIGELRHRTASAKSICIFQVSLLDEGKFEKMLERIPSDKFEIQLRTSPYTDDLWGKNMEIYKKHSPDFISKIEKMVGIINTLPYIKIVKAQSKERAKPTRKGGFFTPGN